jgi:pyruvate carboxylase
MYPKVFDDYMKGKAAKGNLLRYVPSPVYFYGMTPGSSLTMVIPPGTIQELGDFDEEPFEGPAGINVSVTMERVCPLKERHRNVIFRVNGKEQHVLVKDNSGAFVFEGAMADGKNNKQIPSPMPGVIEKVLVGAGDSVKAGDTLMIVSAMKMEVKVTAPFDTTVELIETPAGTRVVEGALLMKLK